MDNQRCERQTLRRSLVQVENTRLIRARITGNKESNEETNRFVDRVSCDGNFGPYRRAGGTGAEGDGTAPDHG